MAASRSSSHVALSSSFYGSTNLIPISNGDGAAPDALKRTKLLLLGMRRSVPPPDPASHAR